MGFNQMCRALETKICTSPQGEEEIAGRMWGQKDGEDGRCKEREMMRRMMVGLVEEGYRRDKKARLDREVSLDRAPRKEKY